MADVAGTLYKTHLTKFTRAQELEGVQLWGKCIFTHMGCQVSIFSPIFIAIICTASWNADSLF